MGKSPYWKHSGATWKANYRGWVLRVGVNFDANHAYNLWGWAVFFSEPVDAGLSSISGVALDLKAAKRDAEKAARILEKLDNEWELL